MKWLKKLLYLVVVILLLEVIKTVLYKLDFAYTFFLSVIIAAIQFLLCIGFIYTVLFTALFQKYFKGKKKNITLIIVFALFLGLAEYLFAFWLHHSGKIPSFLKPAYLVYYDQYDRNIIQFDKQLSVYNPALFYTLKPGISGRYKNAEFNTAIVTNSKGLRDDESSLQKPAIICLGDSYTLGWGVDQQESFPQLLEQLSHKKVLNAGISSYGTAREMILLSNLDTSGLQYIFVQYCENDITENTNYIDNNYSLNISSQSAYDSVVDQQKLAQQYFPCKHFLLTAQIFIKQQINKIYPAFNFPDASKPLTDAPRHAENFLEVLYHSPVDFKKVKVIVSILHSYPNLKNNFLEEVKKLSRQSPYYNRFGENLQVVDVTSSLGKGDFFVLDIHIKASGHQKVAQKLWEAIQGEAD